MKRAISLLLCIFMIICIIPLGAGAASTAVTTLGGLISAVDSAKIGDVITVSGTIKVTETVRVESGKSITITGGRLLRSPAFTGALIEMPMAPGRSDPYKQSYVSTSAVLTLKDITLDGNKAKADSSKVYSALVSMAYGATLKTDNANLINNPDGGISFDHSYISGNPIRISMKKGSVKNNDGYGISTYPTQNTDALLYNFDGTEFSYNGGNGISLNGSAVLKNVKIEHNGETGLFFRCKNGSVTMNGGSISYNGKEGVSTSEGQFIMTSGKINSNGTDGLYLNSRDASAVISGGEISGNKEYAADNYSVIYLKGSGKINTDNKLLLHEWFDGSNRGVLCVPEKLSYSDTAALVETKGAKKWEWIYVEKGCASLNQFRSADSENVFVPSDENTGWAKLADKPPVTAFPVSSLKAASAGVGKIRLTWSAAKNAVGYKVYRTTSKTGSYKLIKTLSASARTYTNTGLTTGKKYYYKVFGYVNYSGLCLEADSSPTAYAVPVPSKVTGVTATQTASSVKLTWKAVPGATGYRIYTYNASTKKYILKKATDKTAYTFTKLKAGTKYTYYIKAYKTADGKAVLSPSYAKIQTATKTKAPVISLLTTKSGTATLKWTKVTGATGYEIYFASSRSGAYKKAGSTAKLTFTKKSLKKGSTYYFKIRTYKTVNSKKIYSSYSSIKGIKIK